MKIFEMYFEETNGERAYSEHKYIIAPNEKDALDWATFYLKDYYGRGETDNSHLEVEGYVQTKNGEYSMKIDGWGEVTWAGKFENFLQMYNTETDEYVPFSLVPKAEIDNLRRLAHGHTPDIYRP